MALKYSRFKGLASRVIQQGVDKLLAALCCFVMYLCVFTSCWHDSSM